MIKYDVYYKDIKIGRIYINEEGKYKYVTVKSAIDQIEKTDKIYIDAKTDRDFGEPIVFFDSRIANCKKFGQEDKVQYPNSDYYFIKDNSSDE